MRGSGYEIRPNPGPDGGWNWSVVDEMDAELVRGWARTWTEAQSEALEARPAAFRGNDLP